MVLFSFSQRLLEMGADNSWKRKKSIKKCGKENVLLSSKTAYKSVRKINRKRKCNQIIVFTPMANSLLMVFMLACFLTRLASADLELDRDLEETIHEMMGQPHFPSYAYTSYIRTMNFTELPDWYLYGMGWTHSITRFIFDSVHIFGNYLPIGWL